ncbi:Glycosyltransferase involved in cell wall bisynthesis [Rubritalea squalenifaciens DSM 18772]|uniref:Glycosyltransferase involved in cell wall bisynthesis n=1 Tax=Rubritalea squalenifaciens DSM 18772 TaxID=1123071 RepID=A0A1M6EK21_9BACT|nr:glycosyltransferase [Rubritalea squalenifaciens]SHI85620.1 Glycosyltransferase involved in cell wall bisynthesis [Rubritalea squalenifaciens DSM 18772]
MASLLKSLEYTSHALRSYVLPSHIRTYAELSKRKGVLDGPLVVFDMVNTQIDNVMGRYLYHIVKDFHTQGYTPHYMANYRFLATVRKKRYKVKLLDMPFSTISSLKEIDRPFIYITDKLIHEQPALAERVIRISYKKRRPENTSEIPLPFFVHPEISTQEEFPPQVDDSKSRNTRIFFGGNTRVSSYGDSSVNQVYKVMNRVHVLETVKSFLPAKQQQMIRESFNELPPITFACVETQHFKIPFAHWLDTIMQADFFLACPGTRMPLCHNLVEALSCGSIPIIQYHKYLTPELIDGENCLTFHDEETLRQAIQRAVEMPETEVLKMRAAALRYYEDNLTEGQFAKRLLDTPSKQITLLLNAYRAPIL